ncbi:MAG: MBL fold metallo-hydrolase [Promethearchaeota archaeon]
MSETQLARIYHSGEKSEGLHLIDLNLYDSSLFANACVFQVESDLLIFDAGTSKSASQIINYIRFHEMDKHVENIYLIPSHGHFDHVGGLPGLIKHYRSNNIPISIITTEKIANILDSLREFTEPAKKQFKIMMGEIEEISKNDMTIVKTSEMVELNDKFSLLLLETPGHCDEHVSPVVLKDGLPELCFFGEALGINLRKHLSPIPASTAPHYNSELYSKSIKKIRDFNPRIGVFSHVGGVMGFDNVQSLCEMALEKQLEITRFIEDAWLRGVHGTKDLVKLVKKEYREYIATCVMDRTIVDNLTFLLVYGILIDLGFK